MPTSPAARGPTSNRRTDRRGSGRSCGRSTARSAGTRRAAGAHRTQLPLLVGFDFEDGAAAGALVVDLVAVVAAVAAAVVAAVAAGAVAAAESLDVAAGVVPAVTEFDVEVESVAAADMQRARAIPPGMATAPESWWALRAGCGRFLRGVELVIIVLPSRKVQVVLVDGFIA